MKSLVPSMRLIVSRHDSRMVIILTAALFLLLLLTAKNGNAASSALAFNTLPLTDRVSLFFTTFFDVSDTFTGSALIIAILGAFLGGINTALAYTYLRMRGGMIIRSGLYSGLGLFMAFVGIGCAACGTVVISLLLGFFGLSTMLSLLPYQGQEIGYIGIIFLVIASYTLARKLDSPNVC